MADGVIFHEYRQTGKLWRWFTVAIVSVAVVRGIITAKDGVHLAIRLAYHVPVAALVLFSTFFYTIETIIDDKGISINYRAKYFPARMTYSKYFAWDEIETVSVGKCSGITKIIRWRIFRFRIIDKFRMGRRIANDIGLNIVLKNGKREFITTAQSGALADALENRASRMNGFYGKRG
jgi:hypothetical protein